MKDVTIGSLFDGICGFPYAGQMCGAKTLFTSEIEPFPIAVAKTRFPDAKHYLDVSQLNGAEVPPVSIVTFGSPCQDMSVAGKQRGMKHEDQGDDETTRSGLFFEAVRIIKEMRKATNGEYPRFAVWENVPGAFSSNQGRDFLAVLQALASVADNTVSIPEPKGLRWAYAGCIVGDGYSIAWRTYDAQYWGVPQRRRRIYLIADFASERAGQILFEQYGVSGHTASCDEAGQETPADAVGRADRGVGSAVGIANQRNMGGISPFVCNESGKGYWMSGFGCLRAEGENRPSRPSHCVVYPAVAWTYRGRENGCNIETQDELAYALREPSGGGSQANVVYPAIARTLAARYDSSPCDDRGQNVIAIHQNADGEVRTSDKAYTVNTNGNATGRNSPVIALQANGIDRALTAGCNGAGWRENEMYTLNTIDRHAVVFENHAQDSRITECGDVAPVVSAKYGTGGNNTPIVCESAATIDCRNLVMNPEQSGTLQCKSNGGYSLNYTNPCLHPKVTGPLMANSHPGSYTGQDAFSDMLPVVPGKPPRRYIVRRLTPTECLRLQGYPDDWCDIAPSSDVVFWNEVRRVYAKIMGKTCKPLASVEAYVEKLKTDAAIYKAAGNSLAIPCAYDVLRRCVDDEWNRQGGMYL